VSLSFHFLNVIKDLEWDRTQEVMGLPQRLGKRWSSIVAGIFLLAAVIIVIQ
jgi:4-hydroxybenzoate polyprenyltransferase